MGWEEGVERSTDDLDADEVQDLEKDMKREHPLKWIKDSVLRL